LTQAVREKLFGHAQRLSLLRHDARGSSDSVYRIQYDAAELQKVTIDGVLTTTTAAITLGVTIVVVCRLDWQLAAVGIVVSPLLVLLTRRYRLRVRPRYRDVKGMETDAMQVVQEALGALRVVKAFGQEDGERDRFSRRSGTGVQARIRLAMAEGQFGLLVSLLVRFFDPASGRVLLDGVDLRLYRLADLRRQVAFVLQDPVLFSTSIAENIRYARPDASLSEVMAAAEQADAHQFIKDLPAGYNTLVGERGMRLSGGERQRISLARAFLKGGGSWSSTSRRARSTYRPRRGSSRRWNCSWRAGRAS
jgi:ABC-type multidrug transport system fused ATPase/permease subunit